MSCRRACSQLRAKPRATDDPADGAAAPADVLCAAAAAAAGWRDSRFVRCGAGLWFAQLFQMFQNLTVVMALLHADHTRVHEAPLPHLAGSTEHQAVSRCEPRAVKAWQGV